MAETCDILVIGGGIAGASAAYELAGELSSGLAGGLAGGARVILLEQEDQPGYHTTGRSAALFTEAYGNLAIRRLTSAGRAFFEAPPEGFAEHPLLSPRGTLFIARDDQLGTLERSLAQTPSAAEVRRISGPEAVEINPALDPDYVAGALHEPSAEDIDVHALLAGFLRGLRRRGGRVVTRARVEALRRDDGLWAAATPAGRFAAPVVVNAAGAWADVVAELAGVRPVGLVPKRRTAFTFLPPEGWEIAAWPATIDIDERFYFKPEGAHILGSPADETPSAPCDARPEELDIAIGVDRIETATRLSVRRLASRRAGLRSFVADKTPVAGFDADAEGFFWLAGQGGYGIQTAPVLARAAAALITTGELPADLKARGLEKAALAPERLR